MTNNTIKLFTIKVAPGGLGAGCVPFVQRACAVVAPTIQPHIKSTTATIRLDGLAQQLIRQIVIRQQLLRPAAWNRSQTKVDARQATQEA